MVEEVLGFTNRHRRRGPDVSTWYVTSETDFPIRADAGCGPTPSIAIREPSARYRPDQSGLADLRDSGQRATPEARSIR